MTSQPGPERSNIVAACLRASLAVVLWASAASAADLAGHWYRAYGSINEFAQTGADVTMNPSSPRVFEGTIDGSAVELTTVDYPDSYSLVLSPDESVLSGVEHTITCFLSQCFNVDINVTMTRCACFDSNTIPGDGCNRQCEVEPCYACSAEPSTCTPVADSTPCENPSQCIAGGTCSAGVCEGGTELADCIDVGGDWLRASYNFDSPYVDSRQGQFLSDGTDFSVLRIPGGDLETTGSVDVTTSAIEFGATAVWPYCSGHGGLSGALAPDGNSYGATGWEAASTPHGCVAYGRIAEVGVRCAPGELDPSDGCVVDSCQRCSGDPVVCVPVPDSTPCHSSDPCTKLATCESGVCVASISDQCPLCTVCDGVGGCTAGPRQNCRPASTRLSIHHDEEDPARDSLKWDWRGGAIRIYDRGRPEVLGKVALCVFDESTVAPSLLFQSVVNEDLNQWDYYQDGAPGWKLRSGGGVSFADRYAQQGGIGSIKLDTGAAGDAAIKLKGRGGNLPLTGPAELPLPLRAQVQFEGGACFEGSYGADDVSRNRDGMFRARSTP